MLRRQLGLGLLAFATLLLELMVIRAFDVILDPSMGYMIVTIAMFSLGLGGIYVYLLGTRCFKSEHALPFLTLAYALATLAVLPLLDHLPFNLNFNGHILVQVLAWLGMYLSVFTPFFLSGLVLALLFSTRSEEIGRLYFADLCGAGLACLLLIRLIPVFGAGGMLFLLAGLLCLAAFFLSSWPVKRLILFAPPAAFLIAWPFLHGQYIEFADHADKRGNETMKRQGMREYVKWDPVSKLEVFTDTEEAKRFSLDGGQQTSWLTRFDGDFTALRTGKSSHWKNASFAPRSLAYFLKRNQPVDALVLGAAVGDEARYALAFGARRVDAVEMVQAMVEAAKTRYADFAGGMFSNPRLHYQTGEARSFLRATDRRYDVIQMFSNHSSSSIAQGNGALEAVYLQTVEAYEEYFSHLKPDGILTLNRHFYPRMLTTAAQAWLRQGRTDFHRHVLVFERFVPDNLPTVLIKMSPWTASEIEEARTYMHRAAEARAHKQTPFKPSPRVVRGKPFIGTFFCGQESLTGFSLLLGSYGQKTLPYPVTVRFEAEELGLSAGFQVNGGEVRDNAPLFFPMERPWNNLLGRKLKVTVSSENTQERQAVSVWLDMAGTPVLPGLHTCSNILTYRMAFNPLSPESNMIPQTLFTHPFPHELAAKAKYRLDPVYDNRPFFNMVRKSAKKLPNTEPGTFLDAGTAMVLNSQLLPFLSKDVLSIFVVGSVSLLFAAIFIFLPLRYTGKSGQRWPDITWFLIYFSCLGAGFIIIELTLIQLCTKLIGYPSYTYAAVLFALLLSAAFGALGAEKLLAARPGRWPWIFVALILYGLVFLAAHQAVFTHFLRYGLVLRCLAATLAIFPLGFFMGMPFPLGITTLGRVHKAGIAWAWGMNGFFTVLGGFVSLLSAFFLGFKATVLIALGIYCCAMLAFGRIARRIRTA